LYHPKYHKVIQRRREVEKAGGTIFENGRKCEKTLYCHPKSKKKLYISSPKIGDNLKDIFFQNCRKFERYFLPKSEKAVSKFSKAVGRYPPLPVAPLPDLFDIELMVEVFYFDCLMINLDDNIQFDE
jgi:hypothetical protein